ncbi:sigma-70 family RNA polymerase sigma factor [Latilactobacillus curvatus]
MTQSDLQTAFDFIIQDDTLIYGVLKDLHVPRQRSNFADLYQIGVIAFVEAYNHFPGNIEVETHRFMVYAYQAVKWAIMMTFRKDNNHDKRIGFVNRTNDDDSVMDYLDQVADPYCNPEDAAICNDLFERLYQVCTPREKRFLVLRYFYNATLKEIAADLNITRRTANNIKFKVQKKFSALLI